MTTHPTLKTSPGFAARPAHGIRGVLGNAAFIRSWLGRRLKSPVMSSDRPGLPGRADAGAKSAPDSSPVAGCPVNHSPNELRLIASRSE
jgi:hypothetical protein